MAKMIRLTHEHVKVGKPLLCDVFDVEGRLLLKQGAMLDTHELVEKLIERGVFSETEDMLRAGFLLPLDADIRKRHTRVCLFAEIDTIATALDETCSHPTTDTPAQVLALAESIQALCELDADAALANVLLNKRARPPIRQMLNAAIITEILSRQTLGTPQLRLSAVAAALTMNIAMLDLQETLYSQETPLEPAQKSQIFNHPRAGAQMLEALGVSDPDWIAIVEQHHEALDGSGYPSRRQGELPLQAQIVALADQYCGVVSERAYRPGMLPNEALKTLLTRKVCAFDPDLTGMLVKLMGIYPPGSVVRLANGELAVVIKHTLNATQPMVSSLLSSNGIRYSEPRKRATGDAGHAVAEVLRMQVLGNFELDYESLWGDALKPVDVGDSR